MNLSVRPQVFRWQLNRRRRRVVLRAGAAYRETRPIPSPHPPPSRAPWPWSAPPKLCFTVHSTSLQLHPNIPLPCQQWRQPTINIFCTCASHVPESRSDQQRRSATISPHGTPKPLTNTPPKLPQTPPNPHLLWSLLAGATLISGFLTSSRLLLLPSSPTSQLKKRAAHTGYRIKFGFCLFLTWFWPNSFYSSIEWLYANWATLPFQHLARK